MMRSVTHITLLLLLPVGIKVPQNKTILSVYHWSFVCTCVKVSYYLLLSFHLFTLFLVTPSSYVGGMFISLVLFIKTPPESRFFSLLRRDEFG